MEEVIAMYIILRRHQRGRKAEAGFEEGADSELVEELWNIMMKNPGSFKKAGSASG